MVIIYTCCMAVRYCKNAAKAKDGAVYEKEETVWRWEVSDEVGRMQGGVER
ncbi:MAG: hypothetical protein K2N63_02505 [Lachnospiraceae bacterium]|nr:hypothetical protein [Lachnospiraceae bacterium]